MTQWNTKNTATWETKATKVWENSDPVVWFKKLQNAIWDALYYLWDDLICTWDARSDSDLWNVKGSGTWYIKN